jgi:hypothetical protein
MDDRRDRARARRSRRDRLSARAGILSHEERERHEGKALIPFFFVFFVIRSFAFSRT